MVWIVLFLGLFVFPGALCLCFVAYAMLYHEELSTYCYQCGRIVDIPRMHDEHRCQVCYDLNERMYAAYPFSLNRNDMIWM